jgi:hypothetical protein
MFTNGWREKQQGPVVAGRPGLGKRVVGDGGTGFLRRYV